uniref:ATP synthase complex subunit 8 n=1 Tax=Tenebrionoidea sp. 21 KM-2017 TaxID=2219477 RepID=A0A346RI56_9CUCU|nr:ATP synthase F0 subunit 8 [Tenebrionoidea sp. 21 KM-2017]
MPQMMPLNWLTLMFFFMIIFFIFNTSNYFLFLYEEKKFLKTKKNIDLNWKW